VSAYLSDLYRTDPGRGHKDTHKHVVHISHYLTPDTVDALREIAVRRRVSLSAVIREAVEEYVTGSGGAQ